MVWLGKEDRQADWKTPTSPSPALRTYSCVLSVPLSLPVLSIRNTCFPPATLPFLGKDEPMLFQRSVVPGIDLWIAIYRMPTSRYAECAVTQHQVVSSYPNRCLNQHLTNIYCLHKTGINNSNDPIELLG